MILPITVSLANIGVPYLPLFYLSFLFFKCIMNTKKKSLFKISYKMQFVRVFLLLGILSMFYGMFYVLLLLVGRVGFWERTGRGKDK